jgi:hypothetical protein
VVLLDTGPVVALFDPRDGDHRACQAILEANRQPLVTTVAVLTEAFHILSPESLGARRLREFVLAGGTTVHTLDEPGLIRAFELMETYVNLPMDLADASLVVVAERLPTRRIFTLDHRDFSTYRIRQGRRHVAFEILR